MPVIFQPNDPVKQNSELISNKVVLTLLLHIPVHPNRMEYSIKLIFSGYALDKTHPGHLLINIHDYKSMEA